MDILAMSLLTVGFLRLNYSIYMFAELDSCLSRHFCLIHRPGINLVALKAVAIHSFTDLPWDQPVQLGPYKAVTVSHRLEFAHHGLQLQIWMRWAELATAMNHSCYTEANKDFFRLRFHLRIVGA